MQVWPPVLMPVWMIIVMIIGILLVSAWLLRTFLVTRRNAAREVGDIPMAPSERRQWGERLWAISQRWDGGELDLRELHLELSALLRGFAEARSGEEITTATVSEILDMAATTGPRSVEERRRSVREAGRPLDANPLGHVGELLAMWEQPSFDREPEAAAQDALTHAREVVTQW
ncbi:alpha-amylase [uncultured Actinomyces sp.]|uniref:alpha-amylase n=1 Tax=uncultured Actinomyces sp. TaxID=249061 RepID=UPI0028D4616C|nr:alpha-amylase [uncultured Actinomyces sp.]